METKELFEKLNGTFSKLINEISNVENNIFFRKEKSEKWSIAEEIQHLSLSILPINNLLSQPKLVIERWGHSNRKSRNMELFLNDYEKATLGQEWKAFPPFVPKTESESPNYAELHYTSNQNKIDDFYNLTGKQIELVRDRFQIASSAKKNDIIKTLKEQSSILLTLSKKMNDDQMDDIQIPLPYIGLVTFREILYFTLNHTEHHFNSVKKLS
ncbi:DinB family protein [Winogradskyella immobilis]|uniref:DinB family protein n=1 Tax=Winogradskyella immobilis TaxID=2816852 RepID=A0ABS8EPD5_9FLAO|nr:DinB family protein [Winogradskyella immobilis]MCC1484430.1 DinB family protein [Winogradskyella immobilis]MCG0016522.1 DinB family protein [Winogradskyella immobilis]